MYSCIIIFFFFLMSTHSFFFFLHLLPPWGGCPSPWACGAYPMAGHDLKRSPSQPQFNKTHPFVITATRPYWYSQWSPFGTQDLCKTKEPVVIMLVINYINNLTLECY